MSAKDTHRDLVPFANQAPLVPGRGGSLARWRLERDKQFLNGEILDLAKVIRRLSEEVVDEIIFLSDPKPKPVEAIHRRLSQLSGALKRESDTLTGLFNLADIHPALEKIFLQKLSGREEVNEPDAIDLQQLMAPPDPPQKPSLRYILGTHEFEILEMVLADMKPKEIAERLNLKPTSVQVIFSNIKRKARELVGKEKTSE